MFKIKKLYLLALSIIACQMAGLVGSIFTFSAIPNWYMYLNKPVFNPPNWIFGPVWTILYLLMGISLFIILNSKSKLKTKALKVFFIQLLLNTLWSIIFFGLQNPLFGLFEIIILLVFIILSIYYFYKINKKAAYLLVPYLLWVSFASFLNLFIVLLN